MKLKNKNDIILLSMVLFVIIVVIGLIIALVVIWSPSKKNREISQYTYNGFEDEIIKYYQRQLEWILRKSSANVLVTKLDEEYLNSINLSKDKPSEVIEYLNKKHLLSSVPTILDYTVSSNDETGVYVYNFTYRTNGFRRNVYLIETEPYVYTLSFAEEFSPTSAIKNKVWVREDIEFNLTLLESTNSSLKYNLMITNNNEKIVKLDFNDVSTVELSLKDGSKIKVASVVSGDEEDFELPKNSTLNQELFFSVPLEQQGQVEYVILHNVKIGNESKSITLEF